MSLTNDDLLAISELLDDKLQPIKEDVSGLKEDVSVLKEDVSGLKEDVSGLKEDVSGLKEDVSGLKEDVSGLKEDVSGLKEDVSGLKDKVGNLEQDVRILKLENENDIKPKLQMILDVCVPAAEEYMCESKKLKKIESDVDVLKKIVKEHSEKLQKLAG